MLAVGALGGYILGYFSGPGPGPEIPSPDQAAVLAELGEPAAFLVGDGTVARGADSARAEVWIYPEAGKRYEFVDGILADEQEITFTSDFADSAFSPTDFDRAQDRSDVEVLLGEAGEALPEHQNTWEGLEAYRYGASRLIVGYLDGWLYVVQTY